MKNIPTNLTEAIQQLTSSISPEQQIKFMDMDEADFTSDAHLLFGASIRNEWGLWKDDSPLVKWFNSIGIEHADDMSSIVITSFYRTITSKTIDLYSQIKEIQDYWSKN